MRIPKSFSTAIANVFYDKTIGVHELIPQDPDAVGSIRYEVGPQERQFHASVRFNDLQTLQEAYGLTVDINIAISTDLLTEVNLRDILSYNNVNYEVVQCIPFDTALMIIGKLWEP